MAASWLFLLCLDNSVGTGELISTLSGAIEGSVGFGEGTVATIGLNALCVGDNKLKSLDGTIISSSPVAEFILRSRSACN